MLLVWDCAFPHEHLRDYFIYSWMTLLCHVKMSCVIITKNTKPIALWLSPLLAGILYHLHNSRASRILQSQLAFPFPCWDKIPDVFVSLPVIKIPWQKQFKGKGLVLAHNFRLLSTIAEKSHGKSLRKLFIWHPQLGAESNELRHISCSTCFLLNYTPRTQPSEMVSPVSRPDLPLWSKVIKTNVNTLAHSSNPLRHSHRHTLWKQSQ